MTIKDSNIYELFQVQYDVLLETLRVEKLEHPETYDTAFRMAEKIRTTMVHFVGSDETLPEFSK